MAVKPLTNLTRAREMQKLSLTDVGSRLGVSENTVRRWEKGRNSVPDEQKLALSKLFGVSPAYLMGWENGDGEAA